MAEANLQGSAGDRFAGIVTALKRGDIALALGVTAILVVLILPLPAWLLDLLLAMSMTDRKSVVSGKSESVCVDLGGRRTTTKKNTNYVHSLSTPYAGC